MQQKIGIDQMISISVLQVLYNDYDGLWWMTQPDQIREVVEEAQELASEE
jgi:hypothetical protein